MIDQAQKLRESFASVKSIPGAETQSRSAAKNPAGGTCRSIAVTSGKGGVGKTNICLSLGITLSMLKKKVLILDADLGLANIHILLGISPGRTLEQYINGECRLDDAIVEGPAGVHILPGATGIESMASIEPLRLGIFTRELSALEECYDFMFIDTGAGIGRVATTFVSMVDKAVLVVTPEPTSLADAYAMVKVLYKKHDVPVLVLVNMASNDGDGKETFDKLNALVVRFLKRPLTCLGIIPFDKQVGMAVRRQSAIAITHPHSAFALRIQQAGRTLCGLPFVKKEGFFSRFLRK